MADPAQATGPEVWFYHLQRQTLDQVLPVLLERSLARKWRAVVQAASDDQIKSLDKALWTYSPESFLAHGTDAEGDAQLQPIWLTKTSDNPNAASLRVLTDGVDPFAAAQDQAYERVMVIFDGNDDEQLSNARASWKQLRDAGHTLSYWQQGEDGRWSKKASS